jgi:hypothetical protein
VSTENHMAQAPVERLVGQLRELLSKATPGPWTGDRAKQGPGNAALIVAAINALPALLAIAEAAELLARESFVDDFGHWGVTDESYEALVRALSLLPNAQDHGAGAKETSNGQ